MCWAGIGTWECGGLHVGKPGSGQPLQRHGGCPPEAVTSHVKWRILRSCLARGFWKQTEDCWHIRPAGATVVLEGGILCVPAVQEYVGSLPHWGEGGEVQGRSAPRAPRIMSSFRLALLHWGQRNRYGCPSCVEGCRGRAEKDWGDGGRQGVGEWCGVMRMCLAGWRFGKLVCFLAHFLLCCLGPSELWRPDLQTDGGELRFVGKWEILT